MGKELEKTLKNNLEKLIELENKTPGVFEDDIQQLKQRLEVIDQDRYRGAIVRARREELAVGEMLTKRMLGVEKTNAHRNQTHEVEWKGALSDEKEDIERAFFEYHQALFSCRGIELEKFKKGFIGAMPRLDDEDKERLQQPISDDEVEAAILNLKPGKAPGPDGLNAAFYKEFKHELSPLLTSVRV